MSKRIAINDIPAIRELVRDREDLLGFLAAAASPAYLRMSAREKGGPSFGVLHISRQDAIKTIIDLVAAEARRQIDEIERKIASHGVEIPGREAATT